MAKNVIRKLKLELEAGKANPAKVGKDLAPTGINLLAFCQKYNELTAGQQGMIIPAEVTVFEDRSFVLDRKSTRLNSSHVKISYAVFWLKKKTIQPQLV